MELIEIKEILRKASVEVDIQGHGKHIALFETDFERVAIDLVKKLTISDVVGRSEQLKAFAQFLYEKEYLVRRSVDEALKEFESL